MKDRKKIIVGTVIMTVVLTLLSVGIQKRLINKEIKVTSYRLLSDVKQGDEITSDMLEEIKLDSSSNNNDYIKSKSEVDGYVVKEKMYKGETINKKRLMNKSDKNYSLAKGTRKFAIECTYFDDTYSLSVPNGSVVDIMFTELDDKKNSTTTVELEKIKVVGKLDSNGKYIENDSIKAQAILFESPTGDIVDVTTKQFKGKFKLVTVPLNEIDE